MGGGVCGAILSATGAEELQAECDSIGTCQVGEAVMTSGYSLIFKSLTEIFANRVLDFYDINTAPIVRAEPANLPSITVQEKTMDFVFYLADDSYLHLEFQSTQGPEELGRFME